ncbi:PREDICTED: phosphatidylserine synthase 2-like [Branchiostoma belcheri]|uniref:Phosphatidylserine synthase n=1 Tax=Branchiostoma belcheri TaxID=7741 RepID=A0A6P5A9Q3_BRABE|nr:PREDICTED: phosphatidylserine synthase 2-like [Branchiostoma belcheri]
MGEASNSAEVHRTGVCDPSGEERDGPRRGESNGPLIMTSDDHVMLPFEFLLKKKLEWSQDNVEYGKGNTSSFRRSWVPAVLACVLIYFALFVETSSATDSLVAKRYIAIFVTVFLVSAVPFAPDGPFKWPHPVFWRLLFCLSVLYQIGLTLLLFQTVDQSRQSLKYLDVSLGVPLSRKSYGENCTFWDPEHPERVLKKLWAECDIYWASHTLGFYFNALALRDYWLAHVLSVMFELVEYSLEHHIPEFQECWWDHWILDVVLCNSLGIWCGMKTLEYLNMRLYNWRSLWDVPVYPSKRTQVDWSRTWRFKRCLCVFAFIASLLIMELNAFYLKAVLWIPISHWLQTVRLVLYLVGGAVVSRRVYRYMDDPNCEYLGYETWMACLLVITEILIIVRSSSDLLQIPFPDHVLRCWIAGFVCLMAWAVWRFFLR